MWISEEGGELFFFFFWVASLQGYKFNLQVPGPFSLGAKWFLLTGVN